jgi:hypothetical protein
MNYISITYELVYRLKTDKHIQLTKDLKMCFNYKTNKPLVTSNNMRKGFWVGRKFYRLDRLKPLIEVIPKYEYIKEDFLTLM